MKEEWKSPDYEFVWFCEECGKSWTTDDVIKPDFECIHCKHKSHYCSKCIPKTNDEPCPLCARLNLKSKTLALKEDVVII